MKPFRRLSATNLQTISQRALLDLDRAYWNRGWVEGRVRPDSATCLHFKIDPGTGSYTQIKRPRHWLSCPVKNERFSTDSS